MSKIESHTLIIVQVQACVQLVQRYEEALSFKRAKRSIILERIGLVHCAYSVMALNFMTK